MLKPAKPYVFEIFTVILDRPFRPLLFGKYIVVANSASQAHQSIPLAEGEKILETKELVGYQLIIAQ